MTLDGLLTELNLPPRRVAVELNRQLVRRAAFGQTTLREGDALEIVTLVGGG
jgi:thiamine biosynthesis protein ThiS